MNYADWLKTVPETLTKDSVWKIEAYRLSLFAADVAWHDVTKLTQDKRTLGLADQLYDAIGSIGANLSECYSRSSGKDRARFYEYSLGSARESRTWYFNAHHTLGDSVVSHRLKFLEQIIRLILKMIPDQREHTLHEEIAIYHVAVAVEQNHPELFDALTSEILNNIPLP